jgi:hypothetical protein
VTECANDRNLTQYLFFELYDRYQDPLDVELEGLTADRFVDEPAVVKRSWRKAAKKLMICRCVAFGPDSLATRRAAP